MNGLLVPFQVVARGECHGALAALEAFPARVQMLTLAMTRESAHRLEGHPAIGAELGSLLLPDGVDQFLVRRQPEEQISDR